MKRKFYFLLMILAIVTACQTETYPEMDPIALSGAYSGTFTRGGEAAAVHLQFNNGRFEGQSEKVKFPAICEGTFFIKDEGIMFDNTCFWTAEFDWTLILDGYWKYRISGEHLVLTNSNGDRYTLTRD